jgi:metal-responsive CopG/Arc/MetJ family transcriptional regulator
MDLMKARNTSASTVNISFQGALLALIDQVAKEEARSRSELIREAARSYIERRRRLQNLFKLGESLAKTRHLKPGDITGEIQAYRRSRKIKHKT